MSEQKIDINRMVRFVTQGDKPGDTRPVPAVVTKVDGDAVSLFVMDVYTSNHVHNVKNDENKALGTWHWPPRPPQ